MLSKKIQRRDEPTLQKCTKQKRKGKARESLQVYKLALRKLEIYNHRLLWFDFSVHPKRTTEIGGKHTLLGNVPSQTSTETASGAMRYPVCVFVCVVLRQSSGNSLRMT
jgi:hypothetical protein